MTRKTYTAAELRKLASAESAHPFFRDEAVTALRYCADLIEAQHAVIEEFRAAALPDGLGKSE